MSESKPNPAPTFAPNGVVWKQFSQTGADGHTLDGGTYCDLVNGWLVRVDPNGPPVFVPHPGPRRGW